MRRLVNSIRRYFKLYRILVKLSVQEILTYRANALLAGLAPIVWMGTQMIFISVLFSKTKSIGGWNVWEVVLLTGIHEVVFLFTWVTFLSNLRQMVRDIRTGKIDQKLLKPVSARFLASFSSLDFTIIGSLVNAVVLIAVSLPRVLNEASLNPFLVIIFLISLVLSYFIAYCVYFSVSAIAFYTNTERFVDWILEFTEFDRFPAEIYPSLLRNFFTFFLPMLFFAYYPAAILLGKVSPAYFLIEIAVAVCFWFISNLIWKKGMRVYQSASS